MQIQTWWLCYLKDGIDRVFVISAFNWLQDSAQPPLIQHERMVAGVAEYWALVQAERTIEDLKFSEQAVQQVH